MGQRNVCGDSLSYADDVNVDKIWPDQKLKKQFCKYWTLRYKNKNEESYALEAPLFREKTEYEQYSVYVQHTSKMKLIDMELKSINRKDDFALINFVLYLKNANNENVTSSIIDEWLVEDGKWYHAISDPFFFPKDFIGYGKKNRSVNNNNLKMEDVKGGEGKSD